MSLGPPSISHHSPVPEAIDHVIVDDTNRLHKCVTDGRSDKIEAAFLEIFTHGIRLRRSRRDLPQEFPCVDARASVDKFPDITIEAADLLLDFEKGSCVLHGGSNFQAIANDSRISQQSCNLSLGVMRNFCWVEFVESG